MQCNFSNNQNRIVENSLLGMVSKSVEKLQAPRLKVSDYLIGRKRPTRTSLVGMEYDAL